MTHINLYSNFNATANAFIGFRNNNNSPFAAERNYNTGELTTKRNMIKMRLKLLILFFLKSVCATNRFQPEPDQNYTHYEHGEKLRVELPKHLLNNPTVLMQIWVDNDVAWLPVVRNTNQFNIKCSRLDSVQVLYWDNRPLLARLLRVS